MNAKTDSAEETLRKFPFWKNLTPEEKNMIINRSSVRQFEKDQVIDSNAPSCMGMTIVLNGSIRVCLLSDEGREITLYRLMKDDCCVTTAACVIQQITFDTVVSAMEPTRLLVIPAPVCAHLVDSNIYVRSFMYETETKRFSQAIWVIQQLLFKRFDQRLASYLISAFENTGTADLKMTQEEIARDVNSAREVVTRMLRHFAAEGLVQVKRGHILLLDPERLRALI